MSFDRLQAAIIKKKNPTVAGLDARVEHIPPYILKESISRYGETLQAAAAALREFNRGLIDALYDVVPAVKPQAAYYEALGCPGMEVLLDTISYAREKGLYVIADIKRGDIGTTAAAYAQGWLGTTKVGNLDCPAFDVDCVTVNGYMGTDAVRPFLKEAAAHDKSLFVLAKTSNPSSGDLQDRELDGQPVYAVMGELIEKWGAGTEGTYGFSRCGAVVGATYPAQLRELRQRLPHTFFLVPGYGAQGGTAEDVAGAFDERGHGAIVNSSRGIFAAWQKTGGDGRDYQSAARVAALQMKADLDQVVEPE